MQLETIRKQFPDACPETDGSFTFDCPVCLTEGHPGKRAKLYASGAISCSRFATTGREANYDHCHTIREMLRLGSKAREAFISETLIDGTLTLECEPAGRDKVTVTANNCSKILHRDVISLDRAKDRRDFVASLK